MKKLMITGFEPFGGETINPSWEAVKALPDTIGDYEIIKLRLPTVYGKAAKTAVQFAKDIMPDVILSIGQAGGRKGVTPEVVAINLREAKIPDNEGTIIQNKPVIEGAPAAYFSTVPVREMTEAILLSGVPASLSYSAGAFVCNDVLYSILHFFSGTKTRAGFIHVPFLPDQAKENAPFLTLNEIILALTEAIKALG